MFGQTSNKTIKMSPRVHENPGPLCLPNHSGLPPYPSQTYSYGSDQQIHVLCGGPGVMEGLRTSSLMYKLSCSQENGGTLLRTKFVYLQLV